MRLRWAIGSPRPPASAPPNRTAVDEGVSTVDTARDAGNKSAHGAFDERARRSKLQLQADKAKVRAKHREATRSLDPAKLEKQEEELAQAIAVHDEAMSQVPSSSGGSGGRKRKTQDNTAETDAGGASAAKKGKRPAKTPTRPA